MGSGSNGTVILTSLAYGNSVTSSFVNRDNVIGQIGITSDPTKSGIINAKDLTKYLFFFVN